VAFTYVGWKADLLPGTLVLTTTLPAIFVALVQVIALVVFTSSSQAEDSIDDLILRARTGLTNVPRRDLRSSALATRAKAHPVVVREALGGITTVLAHLVKESEPVESLEFPFPRASENMRETLTRAISHASGLRPRAAERFLALVSEVIASEIARAGATEASAIEIFPIGLYENLGSGMPRFSPQPALLSRGYPDLPNLMAKLSGRKS
jgi:hypothetical protein